MDSPTGDARLNAGQHSYHHGKVVHLPQCTDSPRDEDGETNDDSDSSDSSGTTDFNDVSL